LKNKLPDGAGLACNDRGGRGAGAVDGEAFLDFSHGLLGGELGEAGVGVLAGEIARGDLLDAGGGEEGDGDGGKQGGNEEGEDEGGAGGRGNRNTCQRVLAGQPAEGSPKGEPRPWEGRDRLPKAAPQEEQIGKSANQTSGRERGNA